MYRFAFVEDSFDVLFSLEMKDSLLLMDAFRELAKMRMTAKLGRDGKNHR